MAESSIDSQLYRLTHGAGRHPYFMFHYAMAIHVEKSFLIHYITNLNPSGKPIITHLLQKRTLSETGEIFVLCGIHIYFDGINDAGMNGLL